MSISGFWVVFGIGTFGGFAVETLRWYKLRESENLPHYATSLRYWGATVAMIIVAGTVSCLYGFEGRNPIAVFQLGASAPALLATFLSEAESSSGGWRGPRRKSTHSREQNSSPSLRSFLSFRG